MKKVQRISIGIPAHNEERNIQRVLKGILSQKQNGWELVEIIVLCDGCTDKTEDKARAIKNKKITILNDGERWGKTQRLNQLFSLAKGDIIIMFDGDIKFANNAVVSNLIKPFAEKNTMLVGGNSMPFTPKTFVEKAVYTTFSVFYESRLQIKGGHNVFGATGSILAIRKSLAKKITLPKIVSEDAYLYMYCISKGFNFTYVDEAVIYYTLPSNFSDYVKQLLRSNPESVTVELEPFFGQLVYQEFERPKSFYAMQVFKAFLKNPLGVISIITINLLARPFHSVVMKNYNLEWFTAKSTH